MPKRACCFECGRPADHNHHVLPRVFGGTKTIPLCHKCHAKVHGAKSLGSSKLIKEGIKKARANGLHWGKTRRCDYAQVYFLRLYKKLLYKEISQWLGIKVAHARQIMSRYRK